jgi:hypothetical protein
MIKNMHLAAGDGRSGAPNGSGYGDQRARADAKYDASMGRLATMKPTTPAGSRAVTRVNSTRQRTIAIFATRKPPTSGRGRSSSFRND